MTKKIHSARDLARIVLAKIEAEDSYATLVLDAEVKRAGLASVDVGLANEIVLGVLRHRTRLDRALDQAAESRIKVSRSIRNALRIGAYQLLMLDRVPDHAVVDDAVTACKRIGGARMGGFVNKLLRSLAANGEKPFEGSEGEVGRLVMEFSMPEWIIRRIQEGCSNQTREALQAFLEPPGVALRCNQLRTTRAELQEHLENEVDGLEIETDSLANQCIRTRRLGNPSSLAAFSKGLFTVQDIGAQLVSELAEAKPGMRIVDLCAGVGGKTSHLAEMSQDAAEILAVDCSETKLQHLQNSVDRLGIRSVKTVCLDLLSKPASLGQNYDVVVLDAPCTGLGVLRRHPEAKWRMKETSVMEMASIQRELLTYAASLVSPGGRLVYSVCSFAREEGIQQIEKLLANDKTLSINRSFSTWPHTHRADGFFAAALDKM